MPTEQFKDVRLHDNLEIQIRNKEHQFKEGDIISVPLGLADKIINTFDVEAESAGNPYEVLERDVDEKIGVRDSSETENSDTEDGESSEELTLGQVEDEDDYRQLQKYAEQFDDVDGSQSKEDLKDDLLERL